MRNNTWRHYKIYRLCTVVLIMIIVAFVYTHISWDNSNTRINKDIKPINNTPVPIPISTPSQFKHTYTDKDGNLHEVTDYTSQGGFKEDIIIKKSSKLNDSSNVVVNQIIPKENNNIIKSIISYISKPKTDSDKIIGTWKYTSPEVSMLEDGFSTEFTFNRDSTGVWIHPLLGKLYFKYRLSDNSIIMSELEPCPYNCEGEAPIEYKFYNDDTLFITIGSSKISLERQSLRLW